MGEVGREIGGVESWMILMYLSAFLWSICKYLRKQHESASFIILSKMNGCFFFWLPVVYCTAHAGPYVTSVPVTGSYTPNQTGLLVTSYQALSEGSKLLPVGCSGVYFLLKNC